MIALMLERLDDHRLTTRLDALHCMSQLHLRLGQLMEGELQSRKLHLEGTDGKDVYKELMSKDGGHRSEFRFPYETVVGILQSPDAGVLVKDSEKKAAEESKITELELNMRVNKERALIRLAALHAVSVACEPEEEGENVLLGKDDVKAALIEVKQ